MNIITADQIQQGDRIRATRTEHGQYRNVSYSYEGVAAKQNGEVWRTEDDGNLWVHEEGAVIELLDRPKPKRLVPTLPSAVVKYTFDVMGPEPRTAVRSKKGKWVCYNDAGYDMNHFASDLDFETMLNDFDYDFDIVFAGVTK